MNASSALADDASGKRLRVAVVVKNYGIQRSPSILLVLDLLVRCGYQVLLILENSGPLPANIQKGIRVLQIPSSRIGKVLALLHLRTYRFDLVLAFDPHAFRLAARFVPLRKIIYYSLELYVGNFTYYDYPPNLASFERRNINEIGGLIIQSDERRRFFVSDYNLKAAIPTLLLPVCARANGAPKMPRTMSPAGARRMLHLGGLNSDNAVFRFCENISKVKDWQLLLHGHGFGKEIDQLRHRIGGYYSGYYTNVRLDEEYFERLENSERLCSQADVGLAWYDGAVSPNFDTCALSSGKIAIYLKYGLPLIVRKYGSYVDILERSGCAVAINSPDNLMSALRHIEANYKKMSECALKIFQEYYNFAKYETSLVQFMTNNCGRRRR